MVVVLACVAAWFFSPKGETQTYATPYPLELVQWFISDIESSLKVGIDPLTLLQNLAKLPHPIVRKLLYHVGYVVSSLHFPTTLTSLVQQEVRKTTICI